jgi:PKHD-type hydroxylase
MSPGYLVPAPDPDPGPPYRSHEIIDALFSPTQCQAILALAQNHEPEPATVGTDDSGEQIDSIRQATSTWLCITDNEVAWIVDRLARAVDEANIDWQFDIVGFAEDLQIVSYRNVGDFYTWHQDGLDGGVADRKLGIVVQLSDPDSYEGAHLELYEVNLELHGADLEDWNQRSSAIGTAIVFPAWEFHRVTPLRRGRRHSLVAWVSGPRFR